MESLVELSGGLQIASSFVRNDALPFPEMRQHENMDSGCSTNTDIPSIAFHCVNGENAFDEEVTLRRVSEEETKTEAMSDCELLENQYWEQLEPTFKLTNPRNARFSEHEKELKNMTYRKLVTKEKAERKLLSSYCKLDKPTTHMLEKLIDVRSLEQYQDVIGKGNHSVVISAGFTNIKHHMPSFCKSFFNAVKVYKLTNNENTNKVIYKRTAREFQHMSILRMSWLLLKVPYPVCYHKNILVMSMVGTHEEPAQPLTSISLELCHEIYDTIVEDMKSFFGFQFVHGKLSAENILIWCNEPYYVGWSHSVWKGEPTALKKLMKDCYFVTKFFKSRNVRGMSAEAMFRYISGTKEISPDVMDVIHNREPRKVKCQGNPNRARPSNAPSWNCRFKRVY